MTKSEEKVLPKDVDLNEKEKVVKKASDSKKDETAEETTKSYSNSSF